MKIRFWKKYFLAFVICLFWMGISGPVMAEEVISSPRVEHTVEREYVYYGWYFQGDTNGDGIVNGNDWTSPIRWQIIKEEGTELVLLSDKVLDYMQFGSDAGWKYSSLRTWLNGTFYTNAFTDEERGAILQTHLTKVSTDSEDYTEDYVYLLSTEDIKGDAYGLNVSNQLNIAEATKYFDSVKINYTNTGGSGSVDGAFSWWLRDRDKVDQKAVDKDGTVGYENRNYNGVRPVIRVDTSKLSFELDREKEKLGIETVEWDRIEFGEYEGKPLNWRVLQVENNQAFILCDSVITEKEFHNVLEPTNWENCTLRSWLNNEFYATAFTPQQQSAITTSYIRGEEHGYDGKDGWTAEGSLEDKIFLLSYADVRNQSYGFPYFCNFSDIFKQATYLNEIDTEFWFLRTTETSFNITEVYNVDDNGVAWSGMVRDFSSAYVTTPYGIRPVLQLDLSKGGWKYVDSYKLGHEYTTRYLNSRTNVKVDFQPGDGTYYSGKPFTPKVEVRYNGELLQEGIHYTLSYRDNVECGTGSVLIQGTGEYIDGVRYVSSTVKYIYIYEIPEPVVREDHLYWNTDMEYRQTEARQMLQRINAFRTGDDAWYWNSDNTEKIVCENLEELTYDYKLEEVAMLRAAEIAAAYGHGRPSGEAYRSAYGECGYYVYTCGENIAAGQRTEEKVFSAWEEADEVYEGQGHRRNMLSSYFKSVGIGHVVYDGIHFWVQEFSSYVNEPNETEAKDNLEEVTIRLDKNKIFSETRSFTMECGEVKDVNDIPLSIRLYNNVYSPESDCETWPEDRSLNLPVTWSAKYSDEEGASGECVLKLNKTSVQALKAGKSVLIAEVLGQGCGSVQVTVNHGERVRKNRMAATCTSTGYTGDWCCEGCNEVLQKGEKISLKKHTYKESILSATLKANGKVKNVCTGCGNKKSVSIPYPKKITLKQSEGVYNGKKHTPKVEVWDAAGQKISNNKYRVDYAKGMTKPGSYTVKVTFTDEMYSGSAKLTYKIQKPYLKVANSFTTVFGQKAFNLGAESNATIKYVSSDPKVATVNAKGKVTIKGTGYCKITCSANGIQKKVGIQVKPKKASINSVKSAAKKNATIKWSKLKGVTGYEIQYSTSKAFKKSTTVKVKSAATTTKTINKFTSKKTYYIRVRGYKNSNGKFVYGDWSNSKKIKIK